MNIRQLYSKDISENVSVKQFNLYRMAFNLVFMLMVWCLY